MLAAEELECVFVVTGVSSYADLAVDCLTAGVPVWTEKPPVATVEEAHRIRAAIGDRQYAVGLKKAFAPANQKLRELTQRDDFGPLRSLALRYAQLIPSVDELRSPTPLREYFLDHLCHPLAVLRLLGGPATTLYYERAASAKKARASSPLIRPSTRTSRSAAGCSTPTTRAWRPPAACYRGARPC